MILTLLATNTSTGVSTSQFESSIDSTYDEYMFVLTGMNLSVTNENLLLNFSTDGGTNYNLTKTTTYLSSYHQEDDSGDVSLSNVDAHDLAQSTAGQRFPSDVNNDADSNVDGILHLFSPASTTYVKHFISRLNYHGGATSNNTNYMANVWVTGYVNTTSDIDAVEFKPESGTMDGVIQMYGVA